MKAIAFKEGLISIAYERDHYQEWARVYMFAKVLMFDADCRMVGFFSTLSFVSPWAFGL